MATATLGVASRRLVGSVMSILIVSAAVHVSTAAAQNAGFAGPVYGTSVTSPPTGEKPQHKLWWNDGLWWAVLYNSSAQRYRIYKLDQSSHTWSDTGVNVDDRVNSKSDVLWDEPSGRLYVVSNSYSSSPHATSTTSRWGRLSRYSYNPSARTFALDPGFPITMTQGTAEALTIAKDSAGRLWAAWVQDSTVTINHTTTDDLHWTTPFALPASAGTGSVSSDDIAGVIAFGGSNVGVMWSNQNTDKTYFAVHRDADAPTTWQAVETVVPGSACSGLCSDDHLNLKTDTQGRVFAALKTSLSGSSSPLVLLMVRGAAGGWSGATFGVKSDHHTRPIVVLDEAHDRLYMFATADENGGAIYYKTSAMSSIAFPAGVGTPFIRNTADTTINNATSTRGAISSASGIVVLASGEATDRYYFNELTLSTAGGPSITSFSPASGTPGTTVTISGARFTGASEVLFGQAPAAFTVSSDSQIVATVPTGATTGRIAVTTPAGTGFSSSNFVVSLPPVVGGFSPATGPVGTSVTIDGSNFLGATQVAFAGSAAAFSITSASSITATVPAGAATGRITVTNSSGTGTSSTDFAVTTGGGGGGSRLRDVTFESGQLVNATTGADRINGSVALETGAPLEGSYAARIPGTGDSYLEVRFAAVDEVFVSFYVRVLALPSADVRIAQVSNAGTTAGNVMLETNGGLRLRSGSTSIGSATAPLSVGQLYRIGLRQRRGTGGNALLEAYVAVGDAQFGAPFASLSNGTWTTQADRLRLGATTASAVNCILDDIRIDAGSMPPPSLAPSPSPEDR